MCGSFTAPGSQDCYQCLADCQVAYEGQIFKKQKKNGELQAQWYVLVGQELYSYKKQGDREHKEMKSLTGVYIKDEGEEKSDSHGQMFLFTLIYPNKKRVYYIQTAEEKQKWVEAISGVIFSKQITKYYEFGAIMGKGKYGVVRKAKHLKTGFEVAIKQIKKAELTLQDIELLKREIEVIKIV